MAPMADDGSPDTGSLDAALEACIRLAGGPKDEERFLGATLALQHAGRIAADPTARAQLLEALSPMFVAKLLRGTSAPYRRIGLAIFRALALEGPGAEVLAMHCASPLASALTQALESKSTEGEGDASTAASTSGAEEAREMVEALRQAAHLLHDQPQAAAEVLALALEPPLLVLAEQVKTESVDMEVLLSALALVQELSSINFRLAAVDLLLETVCLAPAMRGLPARGLALGVLSERIEGGIASCEQLGAVLGEQLLDARAAGLGGGIPNSSPDKEGRWQVVASTLRLAAVGLQRQGLSLLGGAASAEACKRLQALLKLAAGEVHLGLEGLAPLESMCAGCMFAEAATTTLVSEAEMIEEGGGLQASSECLRTLHRIVKDAYDFCLDLLDVAHYPESLPIVARLIAVWQVEDPMRFCSEFQRSLPVLCRLPPAAFEVLLPAVQELQDWHLTPALAKSLELLDYSVTHDDDSCPGQLTREHGGNEGRRALLQPCALGLAEIALDAAAYLPDAPLPEAPSGMAESPCVHGNSLGGLAAHIQNSSIPRPAVAIDPTHQGVQHLCAWSAWLWARGRDAKHLSNADRYVLALACGSLLTSVPEASLLKCAPAQDMWQVVADFVLASHSSEVQNEVAAASRLALRFCGFALDRQPMLAHALVRASAELRTAGKQWLPKAEPRSGNDETDEWRAVDDAAAARVRGFLKAAVPVFKDVPCISGYPAAGHESDELAEALGDMD